MTNVEIMYQVALNDMDYIRDDDCNIIGAIGPKANMWGGIFPNLVGQDLGDVVVIETDDSYILSCTSEAYADGWAKRFTDEWLASGWAPKV